MNVPVPAGASVFLRPGDFYFGSRGARIRTVLGSCVSITLWHRWRRIGGMCHYVLPERRSAHGTAPDGRYAEDAMRLFLNRIALAGTQPAEYEVKLLGGGRVLGHGHGLDIGRRNIDKARRLLRQHGFGLHGEHLAGHGYRHVVFDIASGLVSLRHVMPAPPPPPAGQALLPGPAMPRRSSIHAGFQQGGGDGGRAFAGGPDRAVAIDREGISKYHSRFRKTALPGAESRS